MEIVVGFQGREHVTAGQVGRILAGMAGDGVYVLRTQSQLAASMVTANQVRIGTGDLVMHGRVATVETPETLTVESGVSGQKRSDLVVARYTKDQSTSVEKIELVVVKGTPVSYGDPADPEINEGSVLDGDSPVDVPLWRIPVDGLAPGTPERLFEDAPSSADLRDSVSRTSALIFEGTWNGRSKEFPGLSDYELFRIFVADQNAPFVCCGHRNSTMLLGYCAYTTSYPETHVGTIRFSRDREWLNLEHCYDSTVSGGNVTAVTPTITSIYGVR